MENLINILNKKLMAANMMAQLTGKFGHLKTDEERIIFTLNLMATYEMIPQLVPKRKNSKDSTKLREDGNRIFIGGLDHRAVTTYTESIAFASNSSEELALAYANRSAALFRMQRYADSIADIDRALNLVYPDKLKTKLFERKGLCLTALGRPMAEESFKEALDWLGKMSLSDEKRNKLRDQLNNFIVAPCAVIEVPLEDLEEPQLPELSATNSEVPCASDAIAIKYNEELGRHLIATRKIYPGEVLAVEKAYSLILMPENVYTHCSNCLRVSWAMIPCDYCVNVMYCSERCKEKAWEQYHEVECAIIGPLLDLEFNMLGLFSLRLAVLATDKGKKIEALRAEVEEIDKCKDPRTKGFSEDGKFHSDKYRSIYSLVTNTDKRSVPDLFGRSFNAAYIVCFLATQSWMFGTKLDMNVEALAKNPDITFVGGLILRHQQMIPSNIHCFDELRGMESVDRGAAAMPFYSLTNHSCDPNVTRQSQPEHIVIYAIYPIEKGEQIFDNYGMHYAITPKEARQEKLLKQFHFKCECLPCQEDWPLYEQLPLYQDQPLSRQDKTKIEKVLVKHNRYIDLVAEGEIKAVPNMLNKLLKMIELLYETVQKPCKDLNNVVETVKHVYCLQGNKFKVPDSPYRNKS